MLKQFHVTLISCYFILALFIIVFLACGDSADEEINQPTKTKTQTPQPDDEVIEPKKEAVDFAAEEVAIRELFESHTSALKERDVGKIMSHWLKLETKEVFMIQDSLGVTTIIVKWSGVKDSWEATWNLAGSIQIPVTMKEVGINEKGKEATLRGDYEWKWAGSTKYIAAFRKDKEDSWKIRAIDFGDKGFIKEIKTPKPE